MELRQGFYPALGTPLDKNGNLVKESYEKQIELMITAGASGVLCMGSMGAQDALDSANYALTARVASGAVRGRVPLFIGAMDNSVFRVKERFSLLSGVEFDGVVLTTPFYSTTSDKNLVRFFEEAADAAPRPVYLYDLPVVTKQKITLAMVEELEKHPNIKGIKTGDIVLARKLYLDHPGFSVLFSNIDIFDVARAFGLPRVLDGMFTCTPANAAAFTKCCNEKDFASAAKYLDNILALRDLMAQNRIWPGYTVAMNLLGLDGFYGKGHGTSDPADGEAERIAAMMKKIGEIK